jgi:putative Ca2+/H+ antiporter (TMEM165/GDT1 family)
LITLLFTASGALLTAFAMGVSFGQTLWVWLPNLISGIEQTLLFIICVIFSCREWNENKNEAIDREKLLTTMTKTKLKREHVKK